MDDMTQSDYDELFECLSVEGQQAVARGDVKLEDLVEIVTSARGAELCPHCCVRTIRNRQLGLCSVCAREAMSRAQDERLAQLEAQREAARIKTRIKRVRDELDPDRPRRIPGTPGGGLRA